MQSRENLSRCASQLGLVDWILEEVLSQLTYKNHLIIFGTASFVMTPPTD